MRKKMPRSHNFFFLPAKSLEPLCCFFLLVLLSLSASPSHSSPLVFLLYYTFGLFLSKNPCSLLDAFFLFYLREMRLSLSRSQAVIFIASGHAHSIFLPFSPFCFFFLGLMMRECIPVYSSTSVCLIYGSLNNSFFK